MEGQPQEEPQPMPMQYEQQPPPVYMEQPKPALPNLQGLQHLVANLNVQVLKEPRGFMKVLQFIFGISAFATTTSFSTTFAFLLQCTAEKKNVTIQETITYPFEVDAIRPAIHGCGGNTNILHLNGDFTSDSRFFVAVGVMSFLYILCALALYCVFYTIYENNPLAPVADFAAHAFFAFMWLAGSSAWANSLTALRHVSAVDVIMKDNPDICASYTCTALDEPNYAKIVISLILGFLNVFLWGSNLWFLYKETQFFKGKAENMNNADGAPMPHNPVP